MRRREFMTLLSGAVATWPLTARGQQASLPLIGVLSSGAAKLRTDQSDGLRRGLKEAGFVEGKNLNIMYRGADDHYERLPVLAAELVSQSFAVIATAGGPVAALAAKSATNKIPIVFAAVSDPVRSGLVASINRPGGNVTGNAGLTIELDAKRLELLSELTRTARVIGALVNTNRPGLMSKSTIYLRRQRIWAANSSFFVPMTVLRSRRASIRWPNATLSEFWSAPMRYSTIIASRSSRLQHATVWRAFIHGGSM